MNCLFNEEKITSNERTNDFIALRNNIRQNAVVYTMGVLPRILGIVQRISAFMDYFQHLEFKDWVECLGDQIKDARQGETDCQLVIQMHQEITKSLNRDVGKAEASREALKLEAQRLAEEAKQFRPWNQALVGCALLGGVGVVTFGAAAIIHTGGWALLPLLGLAVGGAALRRGNISLTGFVGRFASRGIAADANAAIADESMNLATRCIETLGRFVGASTRLLGFFSLMSCKLDKMKGGDISTEQGAETYFNSVNGTVQGIEKSCEQFLAVAKTVKTQLESIPRDTSDDNYVDRWLKQQ